MKDIRHARQEEKGVSRRPRGRDLQILICLAVASKTSVSTLLGYAVQESHEQEEVELHCIAHREIKSISDNQLSMLLYPVPFLHLPPSYNQQGQSIAQR